MAEDNIRRREKHARDGAYRGDRYGANPAAFYIEHHILMAKGESGLYGYVICRNTKHQRLGGEMRTMYRLDRDIFDWKDVRERTGQQPRYADLVHTAIQDEYYGRCPTGRFIRSTIIRATWRRTPDLGHYGHGFGVWFMPVSNEYYAGGPLRQDLMVRPGCPGPQLFSRGRTTAAEGPGDFKNDEKLFGPWFTYVNTGEGAAAIADAKKKAAAEQAKWPYRWMEEPLYPLNRTKVTGQLKVADGRTAAGAMVVLGAPGAEIYKQAGDFPHVLPAADLPRTF